MYVKTFFRRILGWSSSNSTTHALSTSSSLSNTDKDGSQVKHYDLIVIGCGSGGMATAFRAAQHGAKVKIFESNRYGGACVNVGCVPKKITWSASRLANNFNIFAHNYGFIFNDLKFDYKHMKQRREEFINNLNTGIIASLDHANIDHEKATAQFVAPKTIEANGMLYSGKYILIVAGTEPYLPDIVGSEYVSTPDDFFNTLETIPKKTAVVGAGYMAVEIAQLLQNLGSDVSLFTRHEYALRTFDIMIQKGVKNALLQNGVTVVSNTDIDAVHKEKNGSFSLSSASASASAGAGADAEAKYTEFDYVIYAIGRGPVTDKLGLHHTDIKQDSRGFIISDEFEQTSQEDVFALGDITNKLPLNTVAVRAGREFADRMFGGDDKYRNSKMDYTNVPTVVFTDPPVGTIGYTEKAIREKVDSGELPKPVTIYERHCSDLRYGMFTEEQKKSLTHLKMICIGANEKVVGLHLMGDECDEMLQGFAIAIKMGATKKDFDSAVAIHPTTAEKLVLLRNTRDNTKEYVFPFEKKQFQND